MRATRFSDLREWSRNLRVLRESQRCPHPGFLKPYHFVTLALLLREAGAADLTLPPELTRYAARMKLWDAVGIPPPVEVPARPSGTQFYELTRLLELNQVDDVASVLSKLIAKNVGAPCSKDTQESLYITLNELLGNCLHHARVEDDLHGLVCAQTWYNGGRAQFAIADSGIGIRQSLSESEEHRERLEHANACEMATELGVSSKLNRGHAGYGLAVARDLASQTAGASLFVQSLNEAVFIAGSAVTIVDDFDFALPGTLVVFEWAMKEPLDIAAVYAGWPKTENEHDDEFF